jgi:carboxylesterase type B
MEREFSPAWNTLVSTSCDIYPDELYEDIKQAYADELVEPFFMGPDEVDRELAQSKDQVLERGRENHFYTMIGDTIKEMEWWACFRTPEQQRKHDKALNTFFTFS